MSAVRRARHLKKSNYRRGAGLLLSASLLSTAFLVAGAEPSAHAVGAAGQQGTDTSQPLTGSAVTVAGRGAFSDLKITVNQTKNLENQDISVTWTGGDETDNANDFLGNYLQIFQCWGTPDPADALDSVNPGPPPTQCEMGGQSNNPASYPIGSFSTDAYTRVLAQSGWSNYSQDQATQWTNDATGQEVTPFVDTINGGGLVEPFVSVDGTVVNQQDDGDFNAAAPQPFWLNPYFSFNTTNEVDFARTYATAGGGTEGQQNFLVDTGLEAPGLGCGQDIETLPDGSETTPQCWLVIVPRSTNVQENPANVNEAQVATSPLSSLAWNNRIAVPLQFNAVGSSCAIGADEQRIVGSELAASAVSSWQPALCSTPGAPPFSYSTLSDDQARNNLTGNSFGAAGMSVFSNPIDASETTASDPVVYAPLTLSGVVVAFNIDRIPATVNGALETSEVPLEGTQIQNLYLTPRLVAKLLTESYKGEFQGEQFTATANSYAWVQDNPTSLVDDPDFLQFNPEFSLLTTQQQQAAASLLVEEDSSDAATAVWKWVLSDPEAVQWLNGTADPWGMKVNPIYSTNAALNPSGIAFGAPTPDSYPQSDPYCYNTGQSTQTIPPVPARPLCVLDWSPFSLDMKTAGQDVATSNNQAKATLDPAALTAGSAWTSNGPQAEDSSFILSITDSASAAQFGDQVASLSPSGADSADRPFVAPDEQSILSGEQAMTASAVTGVLQSDPSSTASGAYPLPLLTYAAATPESLDQPSRNNYASFLQYAAGAGQTPGENVGQLPAGYAPLPAALEAQTVAAAKEIQNPPAVSTGALTPTADTAVAPSQLTPTPAFAPDVAPTGLPVAVTAPAPRAPTIEVASLALHASPQPFFGVGAVRWTLDVLIGLGFVSGLVTLGIEFRRRRRRLATEEPVLGLSV
jgi:hypothetical protein